MIVSVASQGDDFLGGGICGGLWIFRKTKYNAYKKNHDNPI